ncbi:uncharacterized protein LOC110748822 isoform X6 [Prunus avium]|uniref:Uncharacterized protein LOC110748822 isoform X6 n=1 Tax=Prunus avium TaxID=42229 RepID=A0A6P5RRP1_PRUAV|nr:uncharacterized protein LOC110748822 isoform X6 [Prunus avium]
MAKNSGVFIRQLLGNCNHPSAAGLLHHLHRKPIQNLTLVSNTAPSSPQTIDIRSASKPLSYYSLHTPNLQFLQQRRCLSSLVDADSHTLLSGPSNLYVIETLDMHYRLRQKVEDERLSVVFFYTAPGCQATLKWITPIFDELCKQFQHITMAKVYMDKNGPGSPLDIFGDHHNLLNDSILLFCFNQKVTLIKHIRITIVYTILHFTFWLGFQGRVTIVYTTGYFNQTDKNYYSLYYPCMLI